MIAEEGEPERENIGQFLYPNNTHGQWWGWVDLSTKRKKGFKNRVRKINGTVTARIWSFAGGGDNVYLVIGWYEQFVYLYVYLVIGWYEQSVLELTEHRNNGWTPKRQKALTIKLPIKPNNIRNGQYKKCTITSN